MNYIKSLRQYVGTSPIIAPGSAIIVLNGKNEILLQLRSDTDDWGLPCGGMEIGDSFEETAVKGIIKQNEESKDLKYFPLEKLPNLNYITLKLLEKVGYISTYKST